MKKNKSKLEEISEQEFFKRCADGELEFVEEIERLEQGYSNLIKLKVMVTKYKELCYSLKYLYDQTKKLLTYTVNEKKRVGFK